MGKRKSRVEERKKRAEKTLYHLVVTRVQSVLHSGIERAAVT